MKYAAPKLTRYGTVAALTASDLKCTPGTDLYRSDPKNDIWFAQHIPGGSEQWDQYTDGRATGNFVDPVGWLGLINGGCESAELGNHPVTGK